MSTPTPPSFGFTPPPDLPVGRNARALRCLHTEYWRISEKIYYPERVMPRHAHDLSSVTFFLSGCMDECHDRGREVARSGSWVVKPAGIAHANRVGRHGGHDVGPAWVEAVRDHLHDAPARTPSLRTLAREFGVHPTYLARALRRRVGCSIGDYARKLRVERAARMLARRSPAPLTGIALAAGFADQSHLTRMFRDHTGMTPAVYREMVRD